MKFCSSVKTVQKINILNQQREKKMNKGSEDKILSTDYFYNLYCRFVIAVVQSPSRV